MQREEGPPVKRSIRWVLNAAVMVASFLLFLRGGTAVFMVACLSVGYSPFGGGLGPDGPGTGGMLGEGAALAVWRWLVRDPRTDVLYALGGVLVVRVLEILRVPRAIRRLAGAVLMGTITFVILTTSVSDPALGGASFVAALVLGALFGGVILPRRRPQSSRIF